MENTSVIADFGALKPTPNQVRWSPFDLPTTSGVHFINGLSTLCGAGSAAVRNGIAIHIYAANADMVDTAYYNSDGDFLIGAPSRPRVPRGRPPPATPFLDRARAV